MCFTRLYQSITSCRNNRKKNNRVLLPSVTQQGCGFLCLSEKSSVTDSPVKKLTSPYALFAFQQLVMWVVDGSLSIRSTTQSSPHSSILSSVSSLASSSATPTLCMSSFTMFSIWPTFVFFFGLPLALTNEAEMQSSCLN